MLPMEAITMPDLLKFILIKIHTHLIAFDRIVYREIQLIALTLMTSSKVRAPELRMVTRDCY